MVKGCWLVLLLLVRKDPVGSFSPLFRSRHDNRFHPHSHITILRTPLVATTATTTLLLSSSNDTQVVLLSDEENNLNGTGTNTQSPQDSQAKKRVLLEKFAQDIEKLSTLRPNDPSADASAPHALVSAGSSYTRLWTPDTWKKHTKPPHLRYWRHVVVRWHYSTTARMVLPTVLLAVAWSFLVSVLSKTCSFGSMLQDTGALNAASYLSAPLALLLTLRANHSMSRLLEARLAWGRLILHSRSLANVVKIYLWDLAPGPALLLARHLCLLPWTLKAHVRGESRPGQHQVMETLLPIDSDDYQWITKQPKMTVALLSRIRQIAYAIVSSNNSNSNSNNSNTTTTTREISGAVHLTIEERLAGLEMVLGACDRLLSSPIPPTYSRHLSRAICLWLWFLPLSLVHKVGTGSLMAVMAATSYVMVGIDEMGVEIENAFGLLPLQQLAANCQNAVRDNFVAGGDMPTVSMDDGEGENSPVQFDI